MHRPTAVLQGYLIGNGATDSSTDNINIFSLFSTWPLLPQSLAANLTEYICGTLSNPIGQPIQTLSCRPEVALIQSCQT